MPLRPWVIAVGPCLFAHTVEHLCHALLIAQVAEPAERVLVQLLYMRLLFRSAGFPLQVGQPVEAGRLYLRLSPSSR